MAWDQNRRRAAGACEQHRLLSRRAQRARSQARGAVRHSYAFGPRGRRRRRPARTRRSRLESRAAAARMIGLLLITLAAQTAGPAMAAPDVSRVIADAAHSISAGRLDEARVMIGRAVTSGANGAQIERLLADLAFESGSYEEALTRYQHL